MRRNIDELTVEERQSIESCYPDGVEYCRIDPANYLEHDEICRKLNPTAVILPMEKPIPSLAMEHGFRHIATGPNGPMELLSLRPEFKPFVP